MGRTKSIPKSSRQQLHESIKDNSTIPLHTYHHEPILGRCTISIPSDKTYRDCDHEPTTGLTNFITIGKPDEEIRGHLIMGIRTKDATCTKQPNKGAKLKRLACTTKKSRLSSHFPKIGSDNTNSSRFNSIIQRIEYQEQMKRQQNKRRKEKEKPSSNSATQSQDNYIVHNDGDALASKVSTTTTVSVESRMVKSVKFATEVLYVPPLEIQMVSLSELLHDHKRQSLLVHRHNAISICYYFPYDCELNFYCADNIDFIYQHTISQQLYFYIPKQCISKLRKQYQLPCNDDATTIILPIRSRQGVISLFTYIINNASANNNSNINPSVGGMSSIKYTNSVLALGQAVQDGMMFFEVHCMNLKNHNDHDLHLYVDDHYTTDDYTVSSHIEVRIGLTKKLYLLLHPSPVFDLLSSSATNISFKNYGATGSATAVRSILRHHHTKSATVSRKKKRIKKISPIRSITSVSFVRQLAHDMRHIFAMMFPNCSVLVNDATTLQPQIVDNVPMLTAKYIYALVDNVQIQSFIGKQPSQYVPKSVPGLVPTLRPYQSMAVEWMVHREHLSSNEAYDTDEWELVWIVLSAPTPNEVSTNRKDWNLVCDDSQQKNTQSMYTQRCYPMSLPKWRQQQPLSYSVSNNLVLYCPYKNWLANSIQHAKEMTIGKQQDCNENIVKGGILAESMGLGKTVEVLACILSNPYMKPETSSSASTCNTKRKLDFNQITALHDDGNIKSCEGTATTTATTLKNIAYINDMNDFGDADIDSVDETFSCSKMPQFINAMDSAVVVTPMKETEGVEVEEQLFDSDFLGACICGSLIGFYTQNGDGPIVVCSRCDGPMHLICAAFESIHHMKMNTTPRRYRHIDSNTALECIVCCKEQCPCCVTDVESGATLIVTPPAILNQWEREIHHHTRSEVSNLPLRVVVYNGIKRLSESKSLHNGCPDAKYMHPRYLANADIVLISFDALMNDLGHTDENQFVFRGIETTGSLRKRKRYRIVPSPLLSIKWWRVCLDEAQRVETPTAKSAQMALKLHAVHRWCISGTPIQRGNLHDLYGLLLFLRLYPFCDNDWFQKCFNPLNRNLDDNIKHILKNAFWRSTKNFDLVRVQMGIPEQVEKKILLAFSSIEKHFYNRQLEKTILAVGDVADWDGHTNKRKTKSLHQLTDQLHHLRAACCHPQVGSSGIGRLKRHRSSASKTNQEACVSSRVMSMSQILDKFIDDAKIQCEEAQRLAVLHTNGMAATSKLKVEARKRGITISESDIELLQKSCQLYNQSLQLADDNGTPNLVWGEVLLSGSKGFRTSTKKYPSHSFSLEWQGFDVNVFSNEIWAKFDVTLGPSRKITQLEARVCNSVPTPVVNDSSTDFKWQVVFPKDCVFQCMTATGEYVNVHHFSIPHPSNKDSEWVVESGFRTNKSKSWRLLVVSVHPDPIFEENTASDNIPHGLFVGIELNCYEATIASDPLQRLHCLHNAALTYSALLLLQKNDAASDRLRQNQGEDDICQKITTMNGEATKIESLYLDGARAFHRECHRRLVELSSGRILIEQDLIELRRKAKIRGNLDDCWDDSWWDDFLAICHLYGNDSQKRIVCDRLTQDLDGMLQDRSDGSNLQDTVPFPMFVDISGLRIALQMRISDIRTGLGKKSTRRKQISVSDDASIGVQAPQDGYFKCPPGGHDSCMQAILNLNENPNEDDVLENSRCRVCKADWFQTGPKCKHCKVGDMLEQLSPDRVTCQILSSIFAILKSSLGCSIIKVSSAEMLVTERAKRFFDTLDACKKEKSMAYRLWRTHSNLLNDIDELNQCKSAMRLTVDGEDITAISKEQRNAVIAPIDLGACFHDHAAKQAMALGALSRAKGTLQYLKNLSVTERHSDVNSSQNESDEQVCLLCISTLKSDRAVLRCGHSFHYSPCLEKLRCRSTTVVNCPLRCRVKTLFNEVMIASEGNRHDDGSRNQRQIKGSFGTKVSRLVSDILNISDMGEKGLVFSQWDDMLDICEHALNMNNVNCVRVTSIRQIGTCSRRFKEPDCSVMLLNVKNGAEGLTLVEATHVFMVEPLLNSGLDSQAINRTHRIGQNRKTFVWRYIVEDTIEVKIDKLRMDQQDNQLEVLIGDRKKSVIKAGGIDGGFQSKQEVLNILQ